MRVAALCDIHGNLPALRAVLADVRRAGVDRIVVGGDVVPGPMCGPCLDLLDVLETPVSFLAGNGDADVVLSARGSPPARVPATYRPLTVWVARALSPDHLERISSWPRTVSLRLSGTEVLFCHATPRDDNEIFTRRTPEAVLRPGASGYPWADAFELERPPSEEAMLEAFSRAEIGLGSAEDAE